MSEDIKGKIALVFAYTLAIIVVWCVFSITVGFIAARLLNLEVKIDNFYNFIMFVVSNCLTAIVSTLAASRKPNENIQENK